MKSNTLHLVKDISDMILLQGNQNSTAEAILNLISQRVKSLFCIYFLIEDKYLVLKSYKTDFVKELNKIIHFDVYKLKYPVARNGTKISESVLKNKIIISDSLREMYCPVFKYPRILNLIQRLLKVKQCVTIPIRLNDKVIGALFFASKNKLSKSEIETLELYANLSAIALDTSNKFEVIENKYQLEKTTTSMLSHELKTPIAIAHNNLQLLKMYLAKFETGEQFGKAKQLHAEIFKELKSMHGEIEFSIKRLNYICGSIFGLRDSENKDNNIVHKFDIEKQIEQVIESYSKKASIKGMTLKVEMTQKHDSVVGGGFQFEQILTILLDNAIKYTNRGRIDLKVKESNGEIEASVTDTGPGIPDKYKQKIFERFYRHRSLRNKNLHNIEGLGLGLYIAKTLAERIGGSIAVENNPEGKGSKFTVKIPVYYSEADSREHGGI